MDSTTQPHIDEEIRLLINLEKTISEICQLSIESDANSDPFVPRYLIYPYLSKAIIILKREFLRKYKFNYSMLCNSYLKESSERVNQLIASYVQLTRTMSFDKYVRTANLETKHRDSLEKEKYYNESKEIFNTSGNIFKKSFRDPYLSIIHDTEVLMKEYEDLRDYSKVSEFDDGKLFFKYSDFDRLKETRTSLRKTIDEHLVSMLGITRVEAKFNSESS